MRTLLIDNYDSFTYNIAQALAAVNGVAPLVIHNDRLSYADVSRLEIDNIVISPGPGRPHEERDLGVSRDILRLTQLPLLGICMGFQGMALVHGVPVERAPEPRHGRPSGIQHDGTELFDGIPSPFLAICYHSLGVTELACAELEPTAWTDEGRVMAIRHTGRPMWGVQFHPESIGSEHGTRLFENFRRLSSAAGARGPRRFAPAPPRHVAPAADAQGVPRAGPIRFERLSGAPPAERVFDRLFRHAAHAVWLDSSGPGPDREGFSFIAAGDEPSARLLSYHSRSRRLRVEPGGDERVLASGLFDHLAGHLERRSSGAAGLPFDFHGGLIGYFGYELKGEAGGEHVHESPFPDAMFLDVSRFLAFDEKSDDCYVVAAGDTGDEARWIERMADRVRRVGRDGPTAVDLPDPAATVGPIRYEKSREAYLHAVREAVEAIRAGESYQVCLTNRARAAFEGDPLEVYRKLRRLNPAPFSAFLRFGELSVLCSSPERFLRVDPGGRIEARPIKGTIRRSPDPEEDRRLAERLEQSEKDRAENLMIVDLLRNDLGRVAEVGSVRVPRLMALESYATVHHLVSTIEARLRPGGRPVDAVRAAFPGGSMTGAPKLRTMEILDRLEASARGVYSGALGYLSVSGAIDLNIVIRTLVVAHGEVSLGMGGGVVALSDPEQEYDEAQLKARALLGALGVENGGPDE